MLRLIYRSSSQVFVNQSRYIFRHVISPESSKKQFLVIPEIADAKNTLNITNIDIDSASPYNIFMDVSRSTQNFDAKLADLINKFNAYRSDQSYNFSNTILEIKQILEEVDAKFKFLKLISSTTDDRITQFIIYSSFIKIHAATQQILNVKNLGFFISQLLTMELNGGQRKEVEMMRYNWKLFGRYLKDDSMNTIENDLELLIRQQFKFNESVSKSKLKLLQFIHRSDMSDDTPGWLLSQFKVSGSFDSYKINFKSISCISDLLKYCKNPVVRNQIWLSTRQIGGKILFDFKTSNYKIINEIRTLRKKIANDFGEDNYVSFIFNTNSRMAKSLDEVMNVLEVYKNRYLKQAEKEFTDLNQYAIKEKGLKSSLMPWDSNYIQHQYSSDILKCPWSNVELEDQEFNLNLFFEKIFLILQKMFDISFTIKYLHDNEVAIICSTESNFGELIFRINKNSNKKLIEILPLKINNDGKVVKISYIIINLPLNSPNIFNCLEIIGNLGIILRYQLSVDDVDISPLHNGLPPDAINISSQFILHSILSSKLLFSYVFPELGNRKSEDLCNAYISKGINMLHNVACLEALYVSYFDIEMWLSNKSWQNIQVDLWHDFFGSTPNSKLYYPLEKMDEWPCSATSIFSDHLWGGVKHYSLFWTHDIVRILLKKFIAAKLCDWDPNEDPNPELIKLFQQFKNTFIEDKNSVREYLSRFS